MSLDAYLARIGYAGPREPTLATLRAVVAAHATAIPFENIDVLLGRGATLDEAPLADKIVRRRRGGYCFEHNTTMLRALRALGFAAEGLGGRVVWMRPPDEIGPRTHMLLRADLPEGPHLVDVGFGGLTLTGPIRLLPGIEQETPHEPHRLVQRDAGELELQALLDGAWVPLYRFGLQPVPPIDYEVANWFTATCPERLFTANLMCARPEPDCRYALLNDRFTIRRRGQPPERRVLQSAAELGEALVRDFLLPTPEADIAAVWAKVAGK